MKLSFLPGDLHLSDSGNGYVLMMGRTEVFRTHSERAAVTRFNRLRADMEAKGVGPVPVPAAAQIPPATLKESIAKGNSSKPQRQNRKPLRPPAPDGRSANLPKRSVLKASSHSPGSSAAAFRKPDRIDTKDILAELRRQRDRIAQAIATLEALDHGAPSTSVAPQTRNRRLSAAARRKIAEGQRKRWAARKRAAAKSA